MFLVNMGSFTISIFQQVSRKSAKFEQYLLLSQVKCTRRDCVSAICRALSYTIEAGSWPNLRDSVRERSAFFFLSYNCHRLSDVSACCSGCAFRYFSLLNQRKYLPPGVFIIVIKELEKYGIHKELSLIFVLKKPLRHILVQTRTGNTEFTLQCLLFSA